MQYRKPGRLHYWTLVLRPCPCTRATALHPRRSAVVAQPMSFRWTARSFDKILAKAEALLPPSSTLSEAA